MEANSEAGLSFAGLARADAAVKHECGQVQPGAVHCPRMRLNYLTWVGRFDGKYLKNNRNLAEAETFFKTAAFNRSATSPRMKSGS